MNIGGHIFQSIHVVPHISLYHPWPSICTPALNDVYREPVSLLWGSPRCSQWWPLGILVNIPLTRLITITLPANRENSSSGQRRRRRVLADVFLAMWCWPVVSKLYLPPFLLLCQETHANYCFLPPLSSACLAISHSSRHHVVVAL